MSPLGKHTYRSVAEIPVQLVPGSSYEASFNLSWPFSSFDSGKFHGAEDGDFRSIHISCGKQLCEDRRLWTIHTSGFQRGVIISIGVI
jgi:hypothetical protein